MFTWPAADATPSTIRLSLAGVSAESFGDRQAKGEGTNLSGRHR